MVKTAVTQPRLGQLVISKQGRDTGNTFLIIALLGDDHVLVADGRKRSVLKPKKKNCKHLAFTLQVAAELTAKLSAGDRVTDEEIVDAIQRLGENQKEGEVSLGER
ncbi:MAG TPA: RNA-binding protein [Firmicutes bacterium]|jgi:large subunit ribosomal protein L14e|nr:RNA-binding protein [Bacillota bacterium]